MSCKCQNKIGLKIKKLNNFYAMPEYKSAGASAMDLYAADDAHLTFGKVNIVKTGIALSIPDNYEIQIRSRSSLALSSVIVVNSPGTVDSDFVGEICVILGFIGGLLDSYTINRGQRIAQMVLAPVSRANLIEVEELDETARGTGGFGSTGMH